MKKFMVVCPANYDSEKIKTLSEKAGKYYGEKEYLEFKINERTNVKIKDLMSDLLFSNDCNGSLFIIGIDAILASQVDSVYFSKDWEQDDICKFTHLLLFNYGVDIQHEPI